MHTVWAYFSQELSMEDVAIPIIHMREWHSIDALQLFHDHTATIKTKNYLITGPHGFPSLFYWDVKHTKRVWIMRGKHKKWNLTFASWLAWFLGINKEKC